MHDTFVDAAGTVVRGAWDGVIRLMRGTQTQKPPPKAHLPAKYQRNNLLGISLKSFIES